MVNPIDGFIFDLDGTIFRSDELLPGAKEAVEAVQREGKKIVFLSNKAIARRADYARKLKGFGMNVDESQIINSSLVTARYLVKHDPDATAYVVGEKALIDELKSHGIALGNKPEEIDYVIASFDRTFAYEKLKIAYEAIMRGARFIATNSDRTCPIKGGELPDAAGMIGAIEGVTGKEVEMVAGKPSSYMLGAALEILKESNDRCLLVGDRLETDIKMAVENGIKAALVLTGVTARSDVLKGKIKPDYVLETLKEFPSTILS